MSKTLFWLQSEGEKETEKEIDREIESKKMGQWKKEQEKFEVLEELDSPLLALKIEEGGPWAQECEQPLEENSFYSRASRKECSP